MLTALKCPTCSAPIPPTASEVVCCAFCGHVLVDVPDAWKLRPIVVPPFEGRAADVGRPRCGLGKHTYVIDTKLGTGDATDVFLAHRDARLSHRVVLKVLRAEEDADLLAREWRVLGELRKTGTEASDFFRRLLPQRVAHGRLRLIDGDAARTPGRSWAGGPWASAFGHRPGFEATFEDVRATFGARLDPRHLVWMWKRMLDLLGWVHRAGLVHGGVLPGHLLVHPAAHGVTLLGWGTATWRAGRGRERLPARSAAYLDLYPTLAGPPEPGFDLRMSARSVLWLARGVTVPRPLRRLLEDCAERPPMTDGWALRERLTEVAKEVYGPPRFVPFAMAVPSAGRH